jgi:hypothetical protein
MGTAHQEETQDLEVPKKVKLIRLKHPRVSVSLPDNQIDFTKKKRCLECGSDMGRIVTPRIKKDIFVSVTLIAADKRTGDTIPVGLQGFEAYACQECGHVQFYAIVAK